MFLDNCGYHLTVSGDGADCGFLVLTHEAAVTFDIGTEDCCELTLEVFCSHANTSFTRWRGQAKERLELEHSKGRSGSEIWSVENALEWENELFSD
jgi:hypothetical protein